MMLKMDWSAFIVLAFALFLSGVCHARIVPSGNSINYLPDEPSKVPSVTPGEPSWGYTAADGPHTWAKNFPVSCAGQSQSPIALGWEFATHVTVSHPPKAEDAKYEPYPDTRPPPVVEAEDECLEDPAEIALVVDKSGSMTPIWPQVKTWLEALVNAYKFDGEKRKGGLVAWDSQIREEATVLFTDKLSSAELLEAIENLPSPSGRTNGGLALNYTFENLFAVGSDPTVSREIIFISDGVSQTPLAGPAQQFHDNNIPITFVALGDFDTERLNSALCSTCGDRFFQNEDIDQLNNTVANLTSCRRNESQAPNEAEQILALASADDLALAMNMNGTLINNGHNLEFRLTGNKPKMVVNSKILDNQTFELVQIHFHWGSNNKYGSEHTLEGRSFPVEMHVVHRNVKYSEEKDLTKFSDALLVVGFFIDTVSQASSYQKRDPKKIHQFSFSPLKPIVNGIRKLEETKSNQVEVSGVNLMGFAKSVKFNQFYHYSGSLTTPPCSEIATWVVFDTPVVVGDRQIEAFQRFDLLGTYEKPMNNIFRPTQPVNGRVVYHYHPETLTGSSVAYILGKTPRSSASKKASASQQSKDSSAARMGAQFDDYEEFLFNDELDDYYDTYYDYDCNNFADSNC